MVTDVLYSYMYARAASRAHVATHCQLWHALYANARAWPPTSPVRYNLVQVIDHVDPGPIRAIAIKAYEGDVWFTAGRGRRARDRAAAPSPAPTGI